MMVSIDLGVLHSRFLIVFRSANESSLIFYSSHQMLGQKFPAKARHGIVDPVVFVGCITPEMLVSVDAHERFTRFLNSAALRRSRRVGAIRQALQAPTQQHLQI